MTENRWRVLFGAVGLVGGILLSQTEVLLDPLVKLVITCTVAVVAYLKAPDTSSDNA